MVASPAVLAHFSPWSWDVESDVIWCLPGLYVMHGWRSPSGGVDQTRAIPVHRGEWLEGLPGNHRERIRAFCDTILETGVGGELRYPIESGDEIRWLVLQAAVAESEKGRVQRVLGYTRNVTAEKLLEVTALAAERVGIQPASEMSAMVQPGVSVLNRYPFQEALNSRVSGRLQPTLLLFVEVDQLKHQSHENGESANTELLGEVVSRLRTAAGVDALIGRFRAGEFAIAVDRDSPRHSEKLVRRVQDAFSTRISTTDQDLFVDVAIRVTEGEPGTDAFTLIRDAAAAIPTAGPRHPRRRVRTVTSHTVHATASAGTSEVSPPPAAAAPLPPEAAAPPRLQLVGSFSR